jgi:hypothetical protein
MIITHLKGGLGNQMFQYAAGLALAEKHHVDLKLDLSFLETSKGSSEFTKRNFDLEIFDFNYHIASPSEIKLFTGKERTFLYRLRRKLFPSSIKQKIYRYDQLNYDSGFAALGPDVFMDGYFQSPHYFLKAEDQIRSHFRFKNPATGRNKELSGEIGACNSVSIHVRRGDYLSPVNLSLFGNIATLDYYSKAILKMKAELTDPKFYVFSDDAEWVKQNIVVDAPVTYIDFNSGDNSFEDMRLMSLCRHNIIANSSFSWWGAWLNDNPSKKIIAPSRWINDPQCVVEDVIPASWQRI